MIKRSQARTLFQYPTNGVANSARDLITVTTHDQRQLQVPRFLNDTLISFFLQYLLDNVESKIKDKIYIFNTFFFAKLKSVRSKDDEGQSYRCVSKWIKDVKIFSKEFLIMPVCENDHWSLVIVCYPDRTTSVRRNTIPESELQEPAVFVFNSLEGGSLPGVKKTLNSFLKFQWYVEKKCIRTFRIDNTSNRGIKMLFPEVPQQKNRYDCGIFILNYFQFFLRDPRRSYLKIYRGSNLSNWFLSNPDAVLTRAKMNYIIDTQAKIWNDSVDKNKSESDPPQCGSASLDDECIVVN